jgi:hypothetical protein
MSFVPLLASPNIPASEKTCITTVVGLYQLTQILAPTAIRKKRKFYKDGPAQQRIVDTIYSETSAFWDALKSHVPAIREVCESKPAAGLAGKFRHAEGGNVLFRPKGLEAFARATRILVDRGNSWEGAVARLAAVPLELSNDLWREVLWRPETRTMLVKYVRLALNVFLRRAGQAPEPKSYPVVSEYKRITGFPYNP